MMRADIYDAYSNHVREDVHGVNVYIERSFGRSTNEWFDEVLRYCGYFDEVGLLKGLNSIIIGRGVCSGSRLGEYYSPVRSIAIELDADKHDDIHVVGGEKKHVLTHEIMHHAHLNCNNVEEGGFHFLTALALRSSVSQYSARDSLEAVAEIGTGIIHGEQYDNIIHHFYEKFGGPQEVYEIREIIEQS